MGNLNIDVGPKAKTENPPEPITFGPSDLGRPAELIEGALWVVLCVSLAVVSLNLVITVAGLFFNRPDGPFRATDLAFPTACVCCVLSLVGLAVTHKKR